MSALCAFFLNFSFIINVVILVTKILVRTLFVRLLTLPQSLEKLRTRPV